ncbi:amino acid ABC transporter substrate-binding and permease protein [Secundilactobacillus pentosiphilus]|uniref:Amino acid ABC transporter substrate-binding and permease protein n=1 Tax=Secundilactobacillus pentosiphilus TaxID=1714682 RepID=A0A1Z5INP2_9LACO|nr:amino acid ABC transporter permease [Secundilactobacillus pentosiphilus]GAX03353.1 amino acid ABC transporter substrate-binding and permease protein [Secundilactobacillus pentosiphilus]
MLQSYSFIGKYWGLFLKGMVITIELAVISIILGLILGVILSLMKRSKVKVISLIAKMYIGFIRDTPLLVQIYIVYIGLPMILAIDVPDFTTGVVALTLYSAAYIAEIIRSGIESLPFGQSEAAISLGMSKRRVMTDIILPQAFKNILPALGNQFIGNVKDSSLVSVLGISDLMFSAQTVRGSTALGLQPMIVASLLYLVMTWFLNSVLAYIERRMKASDRVA